MQNNPPMQSGGRTEVSRDLFPSTYYYLRPLNLSMCGEVGPDVQALIIELIIRRVEYTSEIHSKKFRHLAQEAEKLRLLRRFYFYFKVKEDCDIPHATSPLETGGDTCQ